MAYTVQVNGVNQFVVAGSLKIDSTIGRRSQAAFYLKADANTHFQQYQQVSIFDSSNVLAFAGFITSPKESKIGFQNSLITAITCTDKHFLADKRIIVASYTNKTCGFIVQDIVNNYLASEGVTVGQIYDGVTPSLTLYPSTTLYPGGNIGLVPSAVFSYARASDALDALATLASSAGIPYYWQIDQNGKIWFVPYTAIVNSSIVDGSLIDQVYNPPSLTRANPKYRNTQYVQGGVNQTVPQDESQVGDGKKTSFTMPYALANTPTITVNTVNKTVGIKGIDTGKDFYWAQGDPVIAQDASETKLLVTDTIRVLYTGQFPAVAIASNGSQITYQASIDGTSGIIEEVETDQTIASASSGLTTASAYLTKYAQQGAQLVFTTLQTGFAQGQIITVNLPQYGLNNIQMLIETVSVADSDGYNMWSTVTCVIGPYDTSWVYFFNNLMKQGVQATSINVGVSQSTSLLQLFTGALTLSATLSATVTTCPLPSTTQFPSTGLLPC